MELTPRKMQILRFIRDFRMTRGYSPSMQEIGDHLGLTKVTVFEHVGGLEREGLLLRGAKHSARSLKISPEVEFPEDDSTTQLPLVGRIAAGSPIEAIENAEYLDLAEIFDVGGNTFVLQVQGDSMVEDHICDGDMVVCQKRNTARNGETVVALLPDGDATLKRYYREKGKIRLQPANSNYDPIIVENIEVQGVVIGVLRQL
jgi:repressor LexA